jgi:nucleotide-binding universal stress UspA family protein
MLHGTSAPSLRSYRSEVRREARAALAGAVVEAGLDPRDIVLRHGSSRRVLELEDQHRKTSDTLFVFERGRSILRHVLFGSLCRWMISRGACDVLLV